MSNGQKKDVARLQGDMRLSRNSPNGTAMSGIASGYDTAELSSDSNDNNKKPQFSSNSTNDGTILSSSHSSSDKLLYQNVYSEALSLELSGDKQGGNIQKNSYVDESTTGNSESLVSNKTAKQIRKENVTSNVAGEDDPESIFDNDSNSSSNSNSPDNDLSNSIDSNNPIDISNHSKDENASCTESESESGVDSGSEDEPPKLKYSRLVGLPPAFFHKDPVSACIMHDLFFAFATHSGVLHLCKPDMTPIRTVRAHRASILSIASNGEYFATASMDGTVVIGSVADETDITRFDFKRPVHAVAIDKDYKLTRWFVSGGMAGKVIISQKNWINNRNDIVVETGNGPIVGIHHIGEVLVWANDAGITVYNVSTKSKILTIPRPENSPRSDLYWPRFHTIDTDRLLVAWADYVYSIRVDIVLTDNRSFLSSAASSFRAPIERKAEVESTLHVDALIAGISSFSNDLLLVLTYNAPRKDANSPKPRAGPPEIRLIYASDGEEVADDEVGLKGYELLGLNDYHLGRYIGESSPPKYYLVSARDAAVAEEFDIHDRLQWCLDRKRYSLAWQMSEHLVDKYERVAIGLNEVSRLLEEGEWTQAAEFMAKVLYIPDLPPEPSEKSLTKYQTFVTSKWEEYLKRFLQSNHVEEILDIVPTLPMLKIDHKIYEHILIYHLEHNKTRYLKLIEAWNSQLYDIKHIQQLLEEKLEVENDPRLRKILSNLYLESNQPSLAISHLIALKDKDLLAVLTKYHALINFLDRLPEIVYTIVHPDDMVRLTPETHAKVMPIVDMLVQNKYQVVPDKVIEILESNSLHLVVYLYLERLYQVNMDLQNLQKHENLMVKLLSKYNHAKLLNFLTSKSNYSIEAAIEIFEKDDKFIKELIYLLGKIGQNRKALKLIIQKINDPDEAIAFVKKLNKEDKELLSFLIDYSINKPLFIRALIEKANDLINPIDLVKKIPEGTIIDNLKENLVNIILSNDLSVLLNENILRIINNETVTNANSFSKLNEKGYLYAPNGKIISD